MPWGITGWARPTLRYRQFFWQLSPSLLGFDYGHVVDYKYRCKEMTGSLWQLR